MRDHHRRRHSLSDKAVRPRTSPPVWQSRGAGERGHYLVIGLSVWVRMKMFAAPMAAITTSCQPAPPANADNAAVAMVAKPSQIVLLSYQRFMIASLELFSGAKPRSTDAGTGETTCADVAVFIEAIRLIMLSTNEVSASGRGTTRTRFDPPTHTKEGIRMEAGSWLSAQPCGFSQKGLQ